MDSALFVLVDSPRGLGPRSSRVPVRSPAVLPILLLEEHGALGWTQAQELQMGR